jgi:hypothetical protein
MSDHLSELTEMTFAFAAQKSKLDSLSSEMEEKILPYEAVGEWLALTVHKSLGTFCVRGVRCQSREHFMEALERREPALLQQLKWEREDLEKAESAVSLFFLHAPGPECADDVISQLCCRRFPLFDQNFAGPLESGQTWWMSQSEGSLSLIFRSLGTLGFRRVLLGPLGIGLSMSADLMPFIREIQGIFNLEHFSLSERGCEIRFHQGHEEMEKIWNEFLFQGTYHSYFAFCDEEFARGIFKKIAFRRRFWMTVEAELKEMLQ